VVRAVCHRAESPRRQIGVIQPDSLAFNAIADRAHNL
jgi:hypothetical protein